jgi:hypothetical protein
MVHETPADEYPKAHWQIEKERKLKNKEENESEEE